MIELFIVGVIVGLGSALLGIGGGMFIVPVLLHVAPDMLPTTVVILSLISILAAVLINLTMNRSSYTTVRMPWTKLILAAALAGFLGQMTLKGLSQQNFKFIFALIMISLLLKNLIAKKEKSTFFPVKLSSNTLTLIQFLGNFLSALTGLGGGVVYMTLARDGLKVPHKVAPLLSNQFMITGIIVTLSGKYLAHGTLGITQNDFMVILPIFFGSFMIAKIARLWAQKVSSRFQKWGLSLIYLAVASKLLAQAL